MKFLNLNALQSLLTALLGSLPIIFAAFGCTAMADGGLDCSHSAFFTPKMALIASAIITLLKLVVIPWLQPGGLIRNLVEVKVPVTTTPAPGTVSPTAVRPNNR